MIQHQLGYYYLEEGEEEKEEKEEEKEEEAGDVHTVDVCQIKCYVNNADVPTAVHNNIRDIISPRRKQLAQSVLRQYYTFFIIFI